MEHIYRKNLLARSLNKMRKVNPFEFGFYPRSWILPNDYHVVQEEFR